MSAHFEYGIWEVLFLLTVSKRSSHCYCLCPWAFGHAETAFVGQGYVATQRGRVKQNLL